MTDIIVVGGGPAGMTAALYALRNGKSALVLEKHGFGGQITYSPKVENWPGTAQMSGNEYADALLDQIMNQGVDVDLAEVVRVEDHGAFKRVITELGEVREARAVILATGVVQAKPLPGEEALVGRGVSYCATCDAPLYRGKTAAVIGYSPREEAEAAGNPGSQYFAVLTDLHSVGVMGDARTYGCTVVLRSVTTDDFMTAEWTHLPYEVLERASGRITNEVKGVSRVVYDITGKPPATVEWE